jgi:hypothetical protein
MRRLIVVGSASIVLAFLAAPALAHSWYPPECCSGQDCHPVPCETLRSEDNGGLTYTPTSTSFLKRMIRPSQDGSCHICTSKPDGGGFPYCVFTLQGF